MSENYSSIREVVLEPSQVKPTYVFSECTAASERERRDRRVKELDQLGASSPDKTLSIAVLKDPQTGDILVYRGNIEHEYASQRSCRLGVRIITNQAELDRYNAETGQISTLGVTDFGELLDDLRLAAKYPAVERDMPKDEFERLRKKQQAWQRKKEDKLVHEMFHTLDDED